MRTLFAKPNGYSVKTLILTGPKGADLDSFADYFEDHTRYKVVRLSKPRKNFFESKLFLDSVNQNYDTCFVVPDGVHLYSHSKGQIKVITPLLQHLPWMLDLSFLSELDESLHPQSDFDLIVNSVASEFSPHNRL